MAGCLRRMCSTKPMLNSISFFFFFCSLTVKSQNDNHKMLNSWSFSFWVVHTVCLYMCVYIHIYVYTHLCTEKWVSFLHAIFKLCWVKQSTGQVRKLKWIPEDTKYKNIIIVHGVNNSVAQKALGSFQSRNFFFMFSFILYFFGGSLIFWSAIQSCYRLRCCW